MRDGMKEVAPFFKSEPDPFIESPLGYVFDDSGRRRYLAWSTVPGLPPSKRLLFVMFNPSAANSKSGDQVIAKCQSIAYALNYYAIEIVNLYSYIGKDISLLSTSTDRVGRLNDMYTAQAVRRADKIICAWGDSTDNVADGRGKSVLDLIVSKLSKDVYHLGLTDKGNPRHPMACGVHSIPHGLEPVLWHMADKTIEFEVSLTSVIDTDAAVAVADPLPVVFNGSTVGKVTHAKMQDGNLQVKSEVKAADIPNQNGAASMSFTSGHQEPKEPKHRSDLSPDPPKWSPSEDQTKALEGILAWWATKPKNTVSLGGYGGTGKTTMVGKLAYDLLKADTKVVFATPTGKAAQVLERSMTASGVLSAAISTVHGLIYIPDADPLTGRIKGWRRRKTLSADLIVLDEASMVTREMLSDLEHFGVPILAVGDHGQLPPVGEEAFLMANPDFRLNKIHRQARGNPVIRLATIIRNGAPDAVVKRLIDDLDDDRIQYTSSAEVGRAFGAPPNMVLCYTNRMRSDINNEMRDELHGYSDEMDPQPGEVVICLKNHRLDDGGMRMIANGMRGVVKSCVPDAKNQHVFSMDVEFDEPIGLVESLKVSKHQFLRDKTFKGFDEVPGDHRNWWTCGALLDYGNCLTCHKSQGSQAEKVTVFMENWVLNKLSEEDRRRWLYTAVSRAREKVMLVF